MIVFKATIKQLTTRFKPLALLMARNGRKTLRIRNTFNTDNISALFDLAPSGPDSKGLVLLKHLS